MKNSLKFSNLPFVYELHNEASNSSGIPNRLPFNLQLNSKYDLVTQEYNQEVDAALSKAYQESSVLGGNVTEDSSGEAYANAILNFVVENVSINLTGLNILDIGCGTGYLLYKFKQLGCSVKGIEPGAQSLIGAKKYNVQIINEFYPPSNFNEKFDLIICSLVLEHIYQPEKFLQSIKHNLNEGGIVILGVPDEEPYIKAGDISMLFHEHWNYFTKTSLSNFLKLNGANNLTIKNSTHGAILFAKFNFNLSNNQFNEKKDDNDSIDFINKLVNSNKKIASFFEKYKNDSIGVFVPGRLVNFISTNDLNCGNLRFYDDDPNIYNKYFPGINTPVKNFNDFKIESPSVVIIMSSFFGEIIKGKILKETNYLPNRIFTWKDFYGSD